MLSFRQLEINDLELVLKWRTSDHVTKFMYTDIEKDLEKQIEWFKKISSDTNQKYWIIRHNDLPIGLISLNNIDYFNCKATSGFYIGEPKYSMISSRVFPYLLNFIFFELKLNKLYIEVMKENLGIIKMDLFYGFRHVGTLKEHIKKNGEYHDVEILEILNSDWLNMKKFHNLISEFPMK